MYPRSRRSSSLAPVPEVDENPQLYCPMPYNAEQHDRTTPHQSPSSPRDSISASSSRSSTPSNVWTDTSRKSSQDSTGSVETKRTYKTGFLKPAQTAQFDFLVERFKHRKQHSKEGLTAANLKTLENGN